MSVMYRVCAVLLVAPLAAAAPAETVPLGSRYTDQLRGFSIQPPQGVQMVRRVGVTEMVQFLLRDAGAGEVPIRISVLRGSQKGEPVADLAAYGKALAAHLLTTQNFKADPALTESTPVAGRPALALAGSVGGAVFGLSRRDVWVQLEPTRFLVVRTTGPLEAKDRVMSLSRSAADTLRVFDADAVRVKLEQDLARGAKVLTGISLPALRRVLARRDYWLAIRSKGSTVGFVHVTETAAAMDDTEGIRTVTEIAQLGTGKQRTLTRDESYVAADRSLERWEFFTADVDGDVERNRHHEFGIQQDNLLVVQTVVGPHETRSHTRDVPKGIYLPKTLGVLAPRLIDRSQPGRWAFAQYDPTTREVEMRTLTVKGPKSVTLSGKTFAAVELTDQMGLGAPVVTLFVDSTGVPLKIIRPDGSVLQQTTEQAMRSSFRRELEMLQPAAR